MKKHLLKRYMILVVPAVLTVFFIAGYFFAYRWSSAKAENTFLVRDIPQQPVAVETEIIISNVTEYFVEICDADTGKIAKTKEKMPVAYLGLSRTALTEKLQDAILKQDSVDKAQGLIALELIEFTKNRVTVRKTYSTKNLPQKYYILAENGKILVYLSDRKTLYDTTDIGLEQLPEQTRIQVLRGLEIESPEELYDFLETFTS